MILVVDDTDEMRHVMVKLLTVEGYEAHGVPSGESAVAFLKTRQPHCLILDIAMPGMDGFEVLAHIRSTPEYQGIRVVMYSAFDGPLKERAMREGADAFIQKGSLDWAQMKKFLERFCNPGTSGGSSQQPPESRVKDVG